MPKLIASRGAEELPSQTRATNIDLSFYIEELQDLQNDGKVEGTWEAVGGREAALYPGGQADGTDHVDDLGVAQAITDPSACNNASGQWTAVFNGNSGRVVSARFLITAPNLIRSMPYSPTSK